MTNSYDFIVIGAGPAGSSIARMLAKKYQVLLVDRKKLHDFKEKCCGGLLAPDAQKILAKFDISLPEEVIGGPQIFAVKVVDLETKKKQKYQRFYINMDRKKFEEYLINLAIAENVDYLDNCEFINFSDNIVTLKHNSIIKNISCHKLIAADGASSCVRKKCSPKRVRPQDLYVSIQELLPNNHNLNHFCAFFDKSITDFYGWAIPKSNGILFGGAFPYENSKQRFLMMKNKVLNQNLIHGTSIIREGSIIARPMTNSDFWCGEKNIFAIGEAASFISPSSAEGFSYAFKSAEILAKLLLKDKNCSLQKYQLKSLVIRANIYGKWFKMPLMYNKTLRNTILNSSLGSI
ncbi:FAD-binding protein [Lentisphaerota bacterium WC36G]|nr:FAD-binding protein [Lentisphaerae bacterium WC36]